MSANLPPPIPPQTPPLISTFPPSSPPMLNLASVAGAGGMTPAELREAVAQGGRFVVFQYCFSVIIISFKRSSPITFIKPGEGTLAKGASYSIVSLLAGWWGIPWGPIWTLTTLATNISGGKDVTREVLSALGQSLPTTPQIPQAPPEPQLRCPEPQAAREARKTLILRLAWAIVILVFLGMVGVGYMVYRAGETTPASPAQQAFREANERVGTRGVAASGNTSQAMVLARQMSEGMLTYRALNFEQAEKVSALDMKDSFKTYCLLTGDRCVFLVRIPELRRFTADAKASLGLEAWRVAQQLLRESGHSQGGMKLAVGLRGLTTYDRILTGSVISGTENELAQAVSSATGFGCERELYSWFEAVAEPVSDALTESNAPASLP